MTVIVTRNVADRFRGFLVSVMLEIAPGVYVGPTMNAAVRERIWAVLSDWHTTLCGGSVVMVWLDRKASGRQSVLTLGVPPIKLIEFDGILLAKRDGLV
jgi:CRISPR-associated protein Cas2